MNNIKRITGILWIAMGLAAIYFMVSHASTEIAKKPILDTKMFWYIIIPIFTPIMLGLCLFGWYAIKGEYDHVPRSNAEIE